MHTTRSRHLLSASALGGIFVAMAAAGPAFAQTVTEEELVVTAGRRSQDVTEIPYNIAAVGAEQIERTGVSTLEDLSRQVPNLVMAGSGDQSLGSQRAIMRGLNISSGGGRPIALEQNSVSSYLGNAPFANFFQIDDIRRVEVLRGPQGTLYGAGALGGAIRLIPNDPVLESFEGVVSGRLATLAHSDDDSYKIDGVLNIPIGDEFALRISANHRYSAGYIDVHDRFVREGNATLGDPVLVDPLDPAGSYAVTADDRDANWSEGDDWRAAMRWRPTETIDITLSHNVSDVEGYGPNFDSPGYDGGPDPLPGAAIVHPDTGEYEVVLRSRMPFDRRSELTALDASIDLGFATLSSTSSHFETAGQTYIDGTWGVLALPPAYLPYYTGTPINPRFNAIQRYDDQNEVFTQELRLVSADGGAFDYILGVFYQEETNEAFWLGFGPGQAAYNAAPGVTRPPFAGDPVGPEELLWRVGGISEFTETALFGDLTWHVTDALSVTVGARTFWDSFDRSVINLNPVFFINETIDNSSEFEDTKFKLNVTYEYVENHRAYLTFSQGFRRGGANAFATTGFLMEPAELLMYEPDSLDNYEVGLKGRFSNGWRYTADVFFGLWENPQLGGFTAVNFWPVVFNGAEAETRGFEFELSGDLTDTLSFQLGYAYTDASLSEAFCLPSGAGDGVTIIPCAIDGAAGTTLPSAPPHSGSITLNYERAFGDDNVLLATINANYKGETRQNLPTTGARYPINSSYWLLNAFLGVETGPIRTSFFVNNLLDERVVFTTNTRITPYAPIDLYDTVGRPREAGIEVSYRW